MRTCLKKSYECKQRSFKEFYPTARQLERLQKTTGSPTFNNYIEQWKKNQVVEL